MPSKFYITTALHYVNDEPHIGHAYETILGDVFSRYFRLFGYDVRFLTGIDEHGQKIVEAAAKAGRSPQEHCDLMAYRFQSVWKQLSIEPDVFFRTTNPAHKEFVRQVLNNLNEKGDIYSADYSGWYCLPDERFWTEKDVVNGNCPLCGRPVEHLTEKNYFFKMSNYQQWLIDWINSHPDFVKPETRKNEVLGFLRQPLGDLCISRPKSRLAWGIPLPFDSDYVTYVWFDALLNYLSATRIHNAEELTPEFWPADLHLIGKDIVTTHAVYWPIMLKAAGYEPPKSIFAHGWWLVEGAKISKSVGNVVKPLDLVEKYGADAFRYVLMREMTPGQDAAFSEEAFVKRYNSDLANDLGNLYSRLAKLWDKFDCSRFVGEKPGDVYQIDASLAKAIEVLAFDVRCDVKDELKPPAAIERILQFVRGINRQLEVWEPWKRGKDDPMALTYALEWAFKGLDLAAELLAPIMPVKMNELHEAIGLVSGKIDPKQGVNLFPRIEFKSIALSVAPTSIETRKTTPPTPPSIEGGDNMISIEEFGKVELLVGKVIEARKLEGSDKLLVLQVDLGSEKRQIVAGIAQSYAPEALIGKTVTVVANLKPAKLRGELSQGMILAGSDGKRHYIIAPDSELAPGSRIK